MFSVLLPAYRKETHERGYDRYHYYYREYDGYIDVPVVTGCVFRFRGRGILFFRRLLLSAGIVGDEVRSAYFARRFDACLCFVELRAVYCGYGYIVYYERTRGALGFALSAYARDDGYRGRGAGGRTVILFRAFAGSRSARLDVKVELAEYVSASLVRSTADIAYRIVSTVDTDVCALEVFGLTDDGEVHLHYDGEFIVGAAVQRIRSVVLDVRICGDVILYYK